MSEECSLSLVSFFYPDVVVSPIDIHNRELGASTEMVNNLGNERGYISVLLCPFVYGLIVLYRSEFSILLFHKEEVGCIR